MSTKKQLQLCYASFIKAIGKEDMTRKRGEKEDTRSPETELWKTEELEDHKSGMGD